MLYNNMALLTWQALSGIFTGIGGNAAVMRTYFIQAEETVWDYSPANQYKCGAEPRPWQGKEVRPLSRSRALRTCDLTILYPVRLCTDAILVSAACICVACPARLLHLHLKLPATKVAKVHEFSARKQQTAP